MPELREAMRAEKPCGAASIVRLNIDWHSASRQYEKRSCSRIASVDQMCTCGFAADALFGSSVEPLFALSAKWTALPP